MSFSIFVIGDKDDVVKQLQASDAVKHDGVGKQLAELLAKHIGESTNAHYKYGYYVELSGHSGHGSPLSLNVTVKAAYLPLPEPDDEVVDATITDHQADVLAAIDKFESDLGFTAPELTGMRIDELRGMVRGIFEATALDEPDPDDED